MKPCSVLVEQDNVTLARVVRDALAPLSWNKARELCQSGRVSLNQARTSDAERRLRRGDRVDIDPTAPRVRRGVLPAEAIVHVDADLVVVNKPSGLLSVPFSPGDRDTLVDQTRAALRRQGPRGYAPELGVVHRIDVDTTGLLLFTRTLEAKRALAQQFRRHSVHRRYVALVHGQLRDARFDTLLLADRGDGLRGSFGHFRRPQGKPPKDARRAVTRVRCLERLPQASLVECQLETGRQHQIRIHLSEAGSPLIGERVYIRDYPEPPIEALRPMLHAIELGFVHPRSGRELCFRRDPPGDFTEALDALTRGELPARR